jgi:hypothetical protein
MSGFAIVPAWNDFGTANASYSMKMGRSSGTIGGTMQGGRGAFFAPSLSFRSSPFPRGGTRNVIR